MGERKFIVPESRLLELLEAEARLQCLENDGVDNWQWYMEGATAFLAEAFDCYGLDTEDEDDYTFENLAMVMVDNHLFEEF